MSNTSLKVAERTKTLPVRTVERQKLADAIVRRDAANLSLEAGRRAVARANDATTKAEATTQSVAVSVAAAAEQDACETAEAYASGTTPPSRTTKRARAALSDAQDEAEAARGALAKLKANLADLEDAALDARNRVVAAADIVLRGPAEQALGEAEEAALRLRALTPVLRFLVDPEITPENATIGRRSVFQTAWDDEIRALGKERAARRHFAGGDAERVRDGPFTELKTAIRRFLEQPPHVDHDWYAQPALGAWRAAREALLNDADAVLPPI
jgi:hypothetical protein